jgi:hypothetical protein
VNDFRLSAHILSCKKIANSYRFRNDGICPLLMLEILSIPESENGSCSGTLRSYDWFSTSINPSTIRKRLGRPWAIVWFWRAPLAAYRRYTLYGPVTRDDPDFRGWWMKRDSTDSPSGKSQRISKHIGSTINVIMLTQ